MTDKICDTLASLGYVRRSQINFVMKENRMEVKPQRQ